MTYADFNKLRNSAVKDLEKSLDKIDNLAEIADKIFKDPSISLNVLMEINNKIGLAKRSLEFNSALWEKSLK